MQQQTKTENSIKTQIIFYQVLSVYLFMCFVALDKAIFFHPKCNIYLDTPLYLELWMFTNFQQPMFANTTL